VSCNIGSDGLRTDVLAVVGLRAGTMCHLASTTATIASIISIEGECFILIFSTYNYLIYTDHLHCVYLDGGKYVCYFVVVIIDKFCNGILHYS